MYPTCTKAVAFDITVPGLPTLGINASVRKLLSQSTLKLFLGTENTSFSKIFKFISY